MFRSLATTGLIVGLLAAIPGPASAAPLEYTGTWTMNADGRLYTLEVEKRGRSIRGVMRPRGPGGRVTRITGTVNRDGAIEFVRDTGPRGPDAGDQVFTGFLMNGGYEARAMAGTYSSSRRAPARFGWYAERRR